MSASLLGRLYRLNHIKSAYTFAMLKTTWRSALPVLGLFLSFLVSARGTEAATFTVANLADSGPGSLRQAVLDANSAAGADAVEFAPGLTGTITITSGQIQISDALVVDGPGSSSLTVSGAGQFRIFYVQSPNAAPIHVTLSGLTLTRGRGFPFIDGPFGGAVYSNGENLTIVDSVISDSESGFQVDPPFDGCGGNVALSEANATLRIVNSLLTGGTVIGFGAESGGNLCVLDGTLLLERTTLAGGTAANGGGLYIQNSPAGSSIVLSTFTGNQGERFGGGIYAESFGAARDTASLTIESSRIFGNTTGTFGLGGGVALNNGTLRLLQSTVSGNEADQGGGIYDEDGHLELLNSTVSGNRAGRLGGGIHFTEFESGSVLLRLTTVSGNSAGTGGGSLVVASPSTAEKVELDHAILANGAPQDVAGFGATSATLTASFSLIEAPGTTIVVGAPNLIGTDPLLGPLAGNGGPTLTHAPLPGSPVLDAGDPAILSPPATDQRGFQRIAGMAVDLGSVEGTAQGIEVPTLSEVGLAAMTALLLAAALWKLRASRAAPSP